jgi:arginine decarboxylase
MDHNRAPVLDALVEFRRRGDVVYGPPGHKQGRGADPRAVEVLGAGVYESDVLALNGLDDRRQSQGVVAQAEELMADAVHAEHAFFATAGSSLSVKTAMISVAGPGEKLLVSRNAHKSVVAGVVVGGIRPVWVHPHFDTGLHLAHPPEPADVDRALAAHPDAKGMLLITPTDWGTCADIAGIAEVCHSYGVPLIVDEAWGAHLPFHPDLPAWGMDAGADVVVTSVHKMGGAVEQSSVFHLQGSRVDPAVLKAREDLLGTTSPSPLIQATLDGWRRQMVQHGRAMLSGALERAGRIRSVVDGLSGVGLMGAEVIRPQGAFELDPLVLTMDVRGLGITGFAASEWLRAELHVDIGAADVCRISARITHADDDETEQRLVGALRALAERAGEIDRAPQVRLPTPSALQPETVMLPRDAYFGPTEQIPVEQAAGRICAEIVTPYPPGVPVLAPGELIDTVALDYLTSGVAAGMVIPDAADAALKTLRVAAGRPG